MIRDHLNVCVLGNKCVGGLIILWCEISDVWFRRKSYRKHLNLLRRWARISCLLRLDSRLKRRSAKLKQYGLWQDVNCKYRNTWFTCIWALGIAGVANVKCFDTWRGLVMTERRKNMTTTTTTQWKISSKSNAIPCIYNCFPHTLACRRHTAAQQSWMAFW